MALKDSESRFTFFLPDARVLSEAEIAAIPTQQKEAADSDKKEGIWLEINCSDESCLGDDGRITIPSVGAHTANSQGIWLNLFCPEGSCELNQMTDLP